jgi:hypothetical protein
MKDLKVKSLAGVIALAALLTSQSASAFDKRSYYNLGSPHAAGDAGTVHVVDQQAGNTWQDWFWRGKDHGFNYQCPWNNGKETCSVSWNVTETHGTTIGFGGGINPGGNSANWFKLVQWSLGASFNFDYNRTQSTSMALNQGVDVRRGQWAEPVFIQVRRWQRGHFKNGWVETHYSPGYHGHDGSGDPAVWTYTWTGNITYGGWETNTAQGRPYTTFNIHS